MLQKKHKNREYKPHKTIGTVHTLMEIDYLDRF